MSILESRPLRLGRNIKHYIAHLLLYYWVYSISVKYLCGLNQYFSEWEHITFWGGLFFLWRVWSIRKNLWNRISLWQNWVATSSVSMIAIRPLHCIYWVFSSPCLSGIHRSFNCVLFLISSLLLSLSSGPCYWRILC